VRRPVFLSALFVCLFVNLNVEASKPVVAVFEIQNKAKLSEDAVEQLTDIIATELSASKKYQIVPRMDGSFAKQPLVVNL